MGSDDEAVGKDPECIEHIHRLAGVGSIEFRIVPVRARWDVFFASVEGFVQGIKFSEGDPKREAAFACSGWPAKHIGDTADRGGAYWGGVCSPYGSPDHHRLIERGIRARIAQSKGLQEALKSTADTTLIHDTGAGDGSPTTSLPTAVFCRILTEIRA